ncbi:hypothetical protein I6F07_18605 [Ensifer sp. IC4062]|nr:hypothetical protein [Ensifer sp. IC4062]MCA1442184.1 hypothetical protein [Ensifer sp. IC4062]
MRRNKLAAFLAMPFAALNATCDALDASAAETCQFGRATLCASQVGLCDLFPDASNTGVPIGTKLTPYKGTLHVTKDNTVISSLEVLGDIVVEAKNVTVKNTRVISDTPWHALRIMNEAKGFTLMDSEIDARGATVNAIYGFGTILRSNIHHAENGMTIWGPSTVRGNFIHDLHGGETDPHFDGIEINGGQNIDIIGNTVINDHGQTSAIMMANHFAGLSDITINCNRLVGGGYTVYLDGRKGGGTVDDASISIINNQIGGGHWGDFALYDEQPVMFGNFGP